MPACDGLPAHSTQSELLRRQPRGKRVFLCGVWGPHHLFWCYVTEEKRSVCFALLFADVGQAFEEGVSYVLLGVFERLGGLQDKVLPCASKVCGSGCSLAPAALSHCAVPFCASVPLLHLPCQTLMGQTLMHMSVCGNQVFVESDFIPLLTINNITTNWFFFL